MPIQFYFFHFRYVGVIVLLTYRIYVAYAMSRQMQYKYFRSISAQMY